MKPATLLGFRYLLLICIVLARHADKTGAMLFDSRAKPTFHRFYPAACPAIIQELTPGGEGTPIKSTGYSRDSVNLYENPMETTFPVQFRILNLKIVLAYTF